MCKKKRAPDRRRLRACLWHMRKNGGRQLERSGHKVRKKLFSMWKKTLMILRWSVSRLTLMVFSVGSAPDSLASDSHLTLTEQMRVPCGPQQLVPPMEGIRRHESSIRSTPKEGKDRHAVIAREISSVRGSGRCVSERVMERDSLAGAPIWIKRLGTGLCVVEVDGRFYRISQPNLRYDSGRGQSQVGLIYERDYRTFCAFIGRKAEDLLSLFSRQQTQEETMRQMEAYLFIRKHTEEGGERHWCSQTSWEEAGQTL